MLQLLFPHWQKQNKRWKEFIWIGAAIVAFTVAMFFQALGPEQMGAIAIAIYFPLSFMSTFIINRLFADSLVGTFRVNFQELDHDLRLLLKQRSILNYRKAVKDVYSYEFPSHHLMMSVQPYVIVQRSGRKPSFATTVSFHQLNNRNKAFVGQLTEAINEMVKQRTRSDNVREITPNS